MSKELKKINELRTHSNYTIVQDHLVRKLGAMEAIVLDRLISLCLNNFEGKPFYQQQDNLAKTFGISKSSVIRIITKLSNLDLLSTTKPKYDNKNYYSLNWDNITNLLITYQNDNIQNEEVVVKMNTTPTENEEVVVKMNTTPTENEEVVVKMNTSSCQNEHNLVVKMNTSSCQNDTIKKVLIENNNLKSNNIENNNINDNIHKCIYDNSFMVNSEIDNSVNESKLDESVSESKIKNELSSIQVEDNLSNGSVSETKLDDIENNSETTLDNFELELDLNNIETIEDDSSDEIIESDEVVEEDKPKYSFTYPTLQEGNTLVSTNEINDYLQILPMRDEEYAIATYQLRGEPKYTKLTLVEERLTFIYDFIEKEYMKYLNKSKSTNPDMNSFLSNMKNNKPSKPSGMISETDNDNDSSDEKIEDNDNPIT
jgi:DNA-binding Lrp family transcriptional regulator